MKTSLFTASHQVPDSGEDNPRVPHPQDKSNPVIAPNMAESSTGQQEY